MMDFAYFRIFLPCLWLISRSLHFSLPFLESLGLNSVVQSKFIQTLLLRRAPYDFNALQQVDVWFHAASGEMESVRSLIQYLLSKKDPCKILLTYSSISAKKLLKGYETKAFLVALPLDCDRKALKKLVEKAQPKQFLLSRTDFHPQLFRLLQVQNVQLSLISFYAPEPPSTFKQIWYNFCLSYFDLIFSPDLFTLDFIGTLSRCRARCLQAPDPRWDQCRERLTNFSLTKTTSHPKEKVIVFGSTWPEDNQALLTSVQSLLDADCKIIWVPHEVKESDIQKLLLKLRPWEGSITLWSETMEWDSPILVVDEIGVLAKIYTWASRAFVGGSFKSKCHSVMEPLVAGCQVFLGPHYKNNQEASFFIEKLKSPWVQSARTAGELKFLLNAHSQRTLDLNQPWNTQFGGTQKIIQLLGLE